MDEVKKTLIDLVSDWDDNPKSKLPYYSELTLNSLQYRLEELLKIIKVEKEERKQMNIKLYGSDEK